MALGEIIVGPDWLFLACHDNRTSSKPARGIYRAFILNRKKRGHLLDLDRQETRREIKWGLERGRVFNCTVPCVRCHTVAWLADWIKAADYSQEQADAIRSEHPDRVAHGLLDFLAQCPGGSYKRVGHTRPDWPEVL